MIDDESGNEPKWPEGTTVPGPLDSPPPSVVVEAEFGAWSQQGPLRKINEDHYLVMRLDRRQETLLTSIPEVDLPRRFEEHGYGLVVADGLGGAGETASRLAISTLVRLMIDFGKWHVRVNQPIAEEIMERAERFYRSVDATLVQTSQSIPRGLHTTLTAVATAGTDLFFAHVGHSRAYVFRDHQLTQLTRDHAGDLGRRGKVVSMGADGGEERRVPTKTLRRPPGAVRIDVEHLGLQDGDLILLCTNGLTDIIDDARIAETLSGDSTPAELCRALVDLAFQSNGQDDVTVVAARYHIRPLAHR